MKITILNGASAGKTFEFDLTELMIGREVGNDVMLESPYVSRFHAKIKKDGEVWKIYDLASGNGVRVNDTLVDRQAILANENKISIGDAELRISGLDGTAEKPAPVKVVIRTGTALNENKKPEEKKVIINTKPVTGEPKKSSTTEDSEKGAFDPSRFSFNNLFNNNSGEEKKEPRQENRFFRVMFYVAIAICVFAVVLFVLSFNDKDPNRAKAKNEEKKYAFCVIRFEKTVFSKDNIFRFETKIDGNTAIFTIDDIKSHRHYFKKFDNINNAMMLRERINETGIFTTVAPDAIGADKNVRRRFTFVSDLDNIDLVCYGDNLPNSMRKVESLMTDFTESYGLQTISFTPEELLEMANDSFYTAEDLFNNREANLENLRNAIMRYRVVVSNLEQFSPAPPILTKAKKHLEDAEILRARKLKDLRLEETTCMQRNDIVGLRQAYLKEMSLTDRDSDDYNRAKQRLHILDSNKGK